MIKVDIDSDIALFSEELEDTFLLCLTFQCMTEFLYFAMSTFVR
jgi:hypothetical protein